MMTIITTAVASPTVCEATAQSRDLCAWNAAMEKPHLYCIATQKLYLQAGQTEDTDYNDRILI